MGGESACDGATFSFSGSAITIDECKCGEVGDEDFGCTNTVGLTPYMCKEGGIPAPVSALAGDNDEDESDLSLYSYEISLSTSALANLWGLAALCMLTNIVALFCCFRKSKSVSFESDDKEQYISERDQ